MNDPADRLTRALRRLGAEHAPPPGWQDRVLAAAHSGAHARRWWLAAPIGGLAVAIALAVLWPRPALTLVVERRGGAALRGEAFVPGDRIRATARGGGRHHAIWVYRDASDLIARCPGDDSCAGSGDAVTLDLELGRLGSYQIIAWAGARELPQPGRGYAADVAAARAAGATSEARALAVR